MTTYVDSSALVPVYVPERFSNAARKVLQATPRVPFTTLHELEVRNAFALLRGRRLISPAEHRAIRTQLQDDIAAGRLVRVDVDWPAVFATACDLSEAHSATLLTRSLDLLHVAAARSSNCDRFVSADDRQLALARRATLKVLDIKRSRHSRR